MLSYAQVWTIVNSWQIRPRETRLRNLAALVYGPIRAEPGSLSAGVRAWPTKPSLHSISTVDEPVIHVPRRV
ncbi:MAG TPA: hypothetical protein VMZ24_05860 [Patescibacteria group bacterium]|nr:hypothetical protein [Patescibacteria group bacterium]